ncbi:hypothetical protein HII31_09032 [Pseudocercospora fuligena]|uniref:Uncharacterized protein n=1 Tax=Pseudocercospora fuligena TaxID=685502 RepID=A0A8H6REF7_9PEZI|nr:hypothetical protein HII31_09032 [Pseudocercospora fuligena]
MSLIMSLLGWPLDMAVGLLGIPPTKRKPEDYFSSRDNLKQKLRDACLLGTNFSKLGEIHDAFVAQCTGTSDGPYWTYATFERLLDRNGHTFSDADADKPLLWRIVQEFAAFPFPYKDDQAFTVRRDVIDAMAIVMDIDDDKFAYHDEDFSVAVAKLRINDVETALSSYIRMEDLARVVKFLVACANFASSKQKPSARRKANITQVHKAVPTADAVMAAIANDTGPEDTQTDLHAAGEVIERELPQAGDSLMLFLFELLASIISKRNE